MGIWKSQDPQSMVQNGLPIPFFRLAQSGLTFQFGAGCLNGGTVNANLDQVAVAFMTLGNLTAYFGALGLSAWSRPGYKPPFPITLTLLGVPISSAIAVILLPDRINQPAVGCLYMQPTLVQGMAAQCLTLLNAINPGPVEALLPVSKVQGLVGYVAVSKAGSAVRCFANCQFQFDISEGLASSLHLGL
jgi:hypothetical protein